MPSCCICDCFGRNTVNFAGLIVDSINVFLELLMAHVVARGRVLLAKKGRQLCGLRTVEFHKFYGVSICWTGISPCRGL